MAKIEKDVLATRLWVALVAALALTALFYLGFGDPTSSVYEDLHPLKFADVIGLTLITGLVAFIAGVPGLIWKGFEAKISFGVGLIGIGIFALAVFLILA